MKRVFITAAVATALIPAAALALEPTLGAVLGKTPSEISANLEESGYDVTRFEAAGARVALTAVKEDRRVEVYVDKATGEVVGVEQYARRGPWPLLGSSDQEIRQSLEAEGYEIRKYERERGRIEVYADRDGRRWEIKIDARDGRVLKVEEED